MALLVFLTPTLLPERERGFLVLQCGIHCGGHAPRGTIAIVAEYRRLGIAPPCIVCIVVQTTDTVGGGGHMGPPGNAAFIAGEHAPRGTITIVAEYRRLGIAPPCIVCIAIQTTDTMGAGGPMPSLLHCHIIRHPQNNGTVPRLPRKPACLRLYDILVELIIPSLPIRRVLCSR